MVVLSSCRHRAKIQSSWLLQGLSRSSANSSYPSSTQRWLQEMRKPRLNVFGMWSVSANRVGYMYDSIFHPDNSLLRSSDVVSPASCSPRGIRSEVSEFSLRSSANSKYLDCNYTAGHDHKCPAKANLTGTPSRAERSRLLSVSCFVIVNFSGSTWAGMHTKRSFKRASTIIRTY